MVAVYSFARRLLGPLWALVPFAALAVMHADDRVLPCPVQRAGGDGRDVRRPGAALGRLGTAAVVDLRSRRRADRGRFLARIDGGIAIIGMLAGFGVVTLGARSPGMRRRAAAWATWFFVGAGVMNAFGLLDAKINSPIYLSSARPHNVVPLAIGTVLAWLVVVAVAFVPLGGLRDLVAERRGVVASIALVGSLLVGAVLASRPLWWTARLHRRGRPERGARHADPDRAAAGSDTQLRRVVGELAGHVPGLGDRAARRHRRRRCWRRVSCAPGIRGWRCS